MSYSSDADCIFVVPDGVEGEDLTRATELVRLASDIIGKPGPDPGLVVDTDLRPEGKGGPQVRTVSSYAAYYAKWASTWEAQMLLRARPGAGDRALAEEVLSALDGFRYPVGGLRPEQVTDIRKLKSRMETERIPKGVPRERHLKLGPGGLSDVEWTIQLLQLQHAHAHPGLRTTSTLGALRLLARLELLEQPQAERLEQAWVTGEPAAGRGDAGARPRQRRTARGRARAGRSLGPSGLRPQGGLAAGRRHPPAATPRLGRGGRRLLGELSPRPAAVCRISGATIGANVFRGRCKSEPAVIVRDPRGPSGPKG